MTATAESPIDLRCMGDLLRRLPRRTTNRKQKAAGIPIALCCRSASDPRRDDRVSAAIPVNASFPGEIRVAVGPILGMLLPLRVFAQLVVQFLSTVRLCHC